MFVHSCWRIHFIVLSDLTKVQKYFKQILNGFENGLKEKKLKKKKEILPWTGPKACFLSPPRSPGLSQLLCAAKPSSSAQDRASGPFLPSRPSLLSTPPRGRHHLPSPLSGSRVPLSSFSLTHWPHPTAPSSSSRRERVELANRTTQSRKHRDFLLKPRL